MYDYLFVPELPKIAMIPSSDLKEHEVKQQNQLNKFKLHKKAKDACFTYLRTSDC